MAENKNKGLLLSILAVCILAGCAEGANESQPADKCVENTKQCDGLKVMVCRDGVLSEEKTCSKKCVVAGNSAQCEDVQITCDEGKLKCEDNELKRCESNAWTVKLSCESTQTCNATKEACDEQITIVCNDGAKRCNGSTPRTCQNNAWVDGTPCGTGEICIGESGSCEKAKCTSGKAECDGNTLKYCDQNSQERTQPCTNGTVCNADLGRCVDPQASQCDVNGTKLADGASLCIGGKLYSCDDGEADFEDCENDEICHDGDNKCEPPLPCSLNGKSIAHGQSTCDAAKDVRTCNDGDLAVSKDCADPQVCVNEDGAFSCKVPAANSCELNGTTIELGKKICVGNTLRTCVAGELDEGVVCGSGKSLCKDGECVAAPCGSIASGSKTCNDDGTQIATCTDGNLTDDNTCTADQKCSLSGNTPKCIDIKTIPVYETITSIHNDYATIVPSECEGKSGNTIEANVQIEGVVTGKYIDSGVPKGLYIQDPSIADGIKAGIFVFCNANSKTNCSAAYDSISIGDNVKVVSDGVGHLNCQMQIRSKTKTTITNTTKTEKITAIPLNISDVNSGKNSIYNGTLVKLSHVTAVERQTSPKGWYVADDDGKRVFISNRMSNIQSLFNEGHEYFITGIVGYYNTTTQVMPRSLIALTTSYSVLASRAEVASSRMMIVGS